MNFPAPTKVKVKAEAAKAAGLVPTVRDGKATVYRAALVSMGGGRVRVWQLEVGVVELAMGDVVMPREGA